MVVGAALFTRSFTTLVGVPLGLEAEDVFTFEVHLPPSRHEDGTSRDAFHTLFQERVGSLASAEAIGATPWLPVKDRYHSWGSGGFRRPKEQGLLSHGCEDLRGRRPDFRLAPCPAGDRSGHRAEAYHEVQSTERKAASNEKGPAT
ncbi:MAG: hypothetical protein P8L30_03240 [Longimicrobiales bacterium]|nr:hypothetical protein [Longimicrobiales bacterium]